MPGSNWEDIHKYIYIKGLRPLPPTPGREWGSHSDSTSHRVDCLAAKITMGSKKSTAVVYVQFQTTTTWQITGRARCKRLPGFNLQTSVVFGPATQKPQAACLPRAISAGAAVCHHGACSARPNHQGRRIRICASDRPEIHSRSTSPSPASKVVRSF